MKTVFALSESKPEPLSHDQWRGVVGQFEVVDTRHHRGEEVVGILWRLDRLADDSERRVKSFESFICQERGGEVEDINTPYNICTQYTHTCIQMYIKDIIHHMMHKSYIIRCINVVSYINTPCDVRKEYINTLYDA